GFAFPICESAKIDGMLKRLGFHKRSVCRISYDSVTNVAIVPYHLPRVAHVFSVVTAETTGEVKVSKVIRVCLPISLHLRESVGLEDSLHFADSRFDSCILARVCVCIVCAIKL